MINKINLLGISGSLRTSSANTRILKAFSLLVPEHVNFNIFDGLGSLPHFSPELEENQATILFKDQLKNADAVIICTPEYAFGVPGVLKNALDWTVSTGDLNEKPVAAISASPLNSGGDKALASLLLTLTALGTRGSIGTSLSIQNVKSLLTSDGLLVNAQTTAQLQAVADNLLKIIG